MAAAAECFLISRICKKPAGGPKGVEAANLALVLKGRQKSPASLPRRGSGAAEKNELLPAAEVQTGDCGDAVSARFASPRRGDGALCCADLEQENPKVCNFWI